MIPREKILYFLFQIIEIGETPHIRSGSNYRPKKRVNGGQIDAMAANNILTDYDLYVGRYSGSVLELDKDPKVLFSMNNTANDYFDNLDNTISYVDNFFENTKAKNMNLMKIITTLEMLFAFSPLILTLFYGKFFFPIQIIFFSHKIFPLGFFFLLWKYFFFTYLH